MGVQIISLSFKLEASLKSVSSEIRNTESKLKDVNKLLKMDPGNTNLLSQKYKTLQQEIQATKQKLDTLKEASKQADQALKDGTISKEQYVEDYLTHRCVKNTGDRPQYFVEDDHDPRVTVR